MYQNPSRRQKIRMRTWLTIGVVAGVAVLVVVLILAGVFPKIKVSGGKLTPVDTLPESVTANENGILYNKNDTLYLMDASGNAKWNQKLELEGAKTASSAQLICNYAGGSLQVMNYSKEQLFASSLESEILKAAAGKTTLAALVSKPSESGVSMNYIYLYNNKGEQVKQLDFGGRQVLDFGFHGDADMFWVLQLDTSGVTPISYINSYKSDGSPTNSIPINAQVIERVSVTNSSIYASGTNSLLSYTYFGEKQGEQLTYGWRPAQEFLTGQAIRIAYIPRTKTADIETTRVYAGDLSDLAVRLPRHISSLAVTETRLYAFADTSVYVYGKDGSLEKEIPLDMTVVKTKQVSNNCVILWDSQKSYIMQLD